MIPELAVVPFGKSLYEHARKQIVKRSGKTCSAKSVKEFSAVGYNYAKILRATP
jgi:hypothetical protein